MRFQIKYATFFLLMLACKSGENSLPKAPAIPKYCRIKQISSNYEMDNINSKNGYLYINEKYDYLNNKLCPVSIAFENAVSVNTIELQSMNRDAIKYSLYANSSYLGSYKNNQKIALNRNITTLRIVCGKTNEEVAIEGWDRKSNYTLLKDTSTYTNSEKTVVLKMLDTNIIFKQPLKLRQPAKKTAFKSKDFNFINKGSRLIIENKKDNSLIDQTACFYDDNNFFIDFIKVNNNRKIEYHYFLSGLWQFVSKRKNKTKINLTGHFEGRLSKNAEYKSFTYEKTILIDSLNIIRTHDFLNNIMIDLPDWVMVRLRDFKADFVIDLPYATKTNFTNTKLYDCNECYLRYSTVKDLLKAQERFKKKGFRLKMLDCYRPYHVQSKLFEAFPVPGYVASPVGGSVHNKGSAVDLTLVDNKGKELDMGTKFDDLSRKSNHSCTNFPDTIIKNRKLLLRIMRKSNFTPISMEWWHYNHKQAKKYPKIDDAFPCK